MGYSTYKMHNLAKLTGDHFIAGSGDIASAMVAYAKAEVLREIVQEYFQGHGKKFNGQDIGQQDVEQAILYVASKKSTKSKRKGTDGSLKFGLQMAATVGGATVGSVIPVAGTLGGAAGGAIAGASLGVGVTVRRQLVRRSKGIYKWLRSTRGEHRTQAANCLYHNCSYPNSVKGMAAEDALRVILQDEFDEVMGWVEVQRAVGRIAARMKSN